MKTNLERQTILAPFKIILLIVLAAQIAVSSALLINRVSSKVLMDESWHMQYYTQFAQGGHCYYPAEDLKRTYDGYTPFASQLFGWGIRYIANDIRIVRAIAGMFGVGAIILVGLITLSLTGIRWFALVAAALSCAIEPLWFMDVGPNTIHVFFALLGLWLLIRDPTLSTRTVALAMTSFFLCYWTKQTGIAYIAAGLFYCLLKSPKKAAAAFAATATVITLTIWWYEAKPDSRFIYLVFKWAQNQPIIWSRLWDQLLPLFSGQFGILLSLTVAGLCMTRSWKEFFHSPQNIFLGTAGLAGAYAACKYGSGLSQLWFFMSILIICGCTTCARIKEQATFHNGFMLSLLLVQALALARDPRPYWVTTEDTKRYNGILNILKTPDKETYYINSGYLNMILGKNYYANVGHDCWWEKTYRRDMYPKTWAKLLETNPWDIVIIDIPLEDGSFMLYEMLNRSYKAVAEIPADNNYPQAGRLRFKKIIFEKKPSEP